METFKTTKKEIQLALKELKPIEEQALDLYKKLANELTDEEIIKELLFISNQEQNHADLIQEIINLLK